MKTKKEIRMEIQETLEIPWQYDYLNKLSLRDLNNLLFHIIKSYQFK